MCEITPNDDLGFDSNDITALKPQTEIFRFVKMGYTNVITWGGVGNRFYQGVNHIEIDDFPPKLVLISNCFFVRIFRLENCQFKLWTNIYSFSS